MFPGDRRDRATEEEARSVSHVHFKAGALVKLRLKRESVTGGGIIGWP